MNKYKFIIFILFLGLSVAVVGGLFLTSHTVSHSACSFSDFYGGGCIAMNSVFVLSMWNMAVFSIKNNIILMLFLSFMSVGFFIMIKHRDAVAVLSVIKYRIRRSGLFLAVFLSGFLKWLNLRSYQDASFYIGAY